MAEKMDQRRLARSPATPTLQALSNELASVENWHKLGVNLGLQGHQLRKLEQDYPRDSDRRKSEMLDLWLMSAVDLTWETVAQALCLMQEHVVADGIRRKYCCSSTTADLALPQQSVGSLDTSIVPTSDSSSSAIGSQVKTQTPIPPHMDDRLVLAKENLRKIRFKYASLFTLALCVLQGKNIDVSILRAFLTALYLPEKDSDDKEEINPTKFISEVLGTAQSVGEIFESLTKNGLLSYKNFYVLRCIINQFAGDDIEMKTKLHEYEQELAGYMLVAKIGDHLDVELHQSEQSEPDQTLLNELSHKVKASVLQKTLKYFRKLWGLVVYREQPRPDPNLLDELSLKVKANVTERTLKYVNELWDSLANQVKLPVTALLFHKIAKGCVEITCLLPCHLTRFTLKQLQESTDYFQQKNIFRVTIAGRCVYEEPLPVQESTRKEETDPGSKDRQLNTMDMQQQIEQNTCGEPSTFEQGESTTIPMETETQEQQEAEHQHMDVDTTLSLVCKFLSPVNSGMTVLEQRTGKVPLHSMRQADVKVPKGSRLQRHYSLPLIPSTPMYCLETGSENLDPFPIDVQKHSHSLDRLAYHQPRKPLSSTSSSVNFSPLASPRSLSPMTSPFPSRKQWSRSSSPLYSSIQQSRSSSSHSSKQWSRSSSPLYMYSQTKRSRSSSPLYSTKRLSRSSSSLHSPKRLSRSLSPVAGTGMRFSRSHSLPSRSRSPSPSSSIVDPWRRVHIGHGATMFEEPMDWSNLLPLEMKLLEACQYGRSGQVRYLLKTGVNVNVADIDGRTALKQASLNGHQNIVDVLLRGGANPDLHDRNGFFPLYSASQEGHDKIVKMLLRAGATVDLQSKGHKLMLSLDANKGNHELCSVQTQETILEELLQGAQLNLHNQC